MAVSQDMEDCCPHDEGCRKYLASFDAAEALVKVVRDSDESIGPWKRRERKRRSYLWTILPTGLEID